jgi:hypothetical protein
MAAKLPTVTAPNATFTDDTRDRLLTRVMNRLARAGAKIENIACDGWEARTSQMRREGYLPFARQWLIDFEINGFNACIVINESGDENKRSCGGRIGIGIGVSGLATKKNESLKAKFAIGWSNNMDGDAWLAGTEW